MASEMVIRSVSIPKVLLLGPLTKLSPLLRCIQPKHLSHPNSFDDLVMNYAYPLTVRGHGNAAEHALVEGGGLDMASWWRFTSFKILVIF